LEEKSRTKGPRFFRKEVQIMTTSNEYIKFEKKNIETLSNLRKQKYNFEPTYYQVIEENIRNDNPSKKYFNKLVKHFDSKRKLTLCEYCLKPTSHHIIDEEIITKIKGIPIKYKGKHAYCDQCNQNKYVEEIMEYNKKQCYNKIFQNTKI